MKAYPLRADSIARLTPTPFHTFNLGKSSLDVFLSTDKQLVQLFLHERNTEIGCRAFVENQTLPFSLKYIIEDSRLFISFGDQLIVIDTNLDFISIIPNWTAASMYLANGILYAELAFAEPYGEGIDTHSFKRLGMYRKTRPFNLKTAVQAEVLK